MKTVADVEIVIATASRSRANVAMIKNYYG
jgi:hypothetical protein